MTNDLNLKEMALTHLNHFSKAFQTSKLGKVEEIRLQEIIDTTIKKISRKSTVDNTFLIALEKFYQSTSFMVGLINLKLNEEAYQAWRAYDKFHYDNVKPNLRLYGNIMGPI